MRIALFFLVLGVLHAHATDAYSQKTRLSLNFSNTELNNVLDKIEEESEFFFLYNEKLLDTDRKVNIKADDQLISVILDNLFAGTDVKYSIIDRKIILAPEYLTNEADKLAAQQQQTITGIVMDASTGEPMPGVNIILKGTVIGTMSDLNGRFSLEVPDTKTGILVVSFIGYSAQEVAIEGRSIINILLTAEITGLDEVVVIGYGTTKKVSLTSAVDVVNAQKLTERTTATFTQQLQGLLPGLTIIDLS